MMSCWFFIFQFFFNFFAPFLGSAIYLRISADVDVDIEHSCVPMSAAGVGRGLDSSCRIRTAPFSFVSLSLLPGSFCYNFHPACLFCELSFCPSLSFPSLLYYFNYSSAL